MKLKIVIHGPKIHNVGYRYFLLSNADNLGLKGFSARNMKANGEQAVQILVEGDDDQVNEFREIAKTQQPKAAQVAEVAFEDYQDRVESLSKFSFRFQSLQVSKGIESILRIEKLQETMLEKQDQMLGKQDQMLDKQDQMLDKLENVRLDIVDEIRTSSESLISEMKNAGKRNAVDLRDSHTDLKSYLDEKLGKIEVDISRIKARIGM
ncbi:MAG: acylphosphatase [Methanothrix sp.]|nr:acylphosphatase [Methanothrix sp.]